MIQITNPKKFLAVIGLAVVIFLIVFWQIFWGSATIHKSGDVVVPAGKSAGSVWRDLRQDEYSNHILPWKYYGWKYGANQKLKAGTYHLETGEAVSAVVQRMVAGDVAKSDVSITYPEGFRLEQIAARTATRGIGTEADFLASAKASAYANKYPFLNNLPAGRTLEGYLFPDTYRVFPDDKPSDVIERMLTNFQKKVTDDILSDALKQHRSLDQIIIMASILEREVNVPADMAKVSGIFWKRFDEGSGLGSDITVRYALDKWDQELTAQDLNIDSPYNTRKYRGLPPSPIDNPGLQAIMAAVRPEKTPYYYYLTAPDGSTIFAKTNEEHNRNKAKYLR